MYKLPSTLTDDIAYFGTLIDDFQKGKIEPVKFKGTRVPMGIYEQRKDGTYMVRVRTTGGFITPQQLKQVALTAQAHQSPFLHITTRQEIQIHHIGIDQVKTILPELQQVELSSKGGGGNTTRNILVDIESGISAKEEFDVLPYAIDLTTRLIAEADSFTLPRKLKIAFSAHVENGDLALVNDLGFVAKTVDGKRGFTVYLGGSLASHATLGWKVFDFAPEEELYYIAEAAKQFFSTHGNRKNRHKARIRYIFYKLGEEKTLEFFFNAYNELKKDPSLKYTPGKLDVQLTPPSFAPVTIESTAFEVWKNRYAQPQKQAGLFAVTIPVEHGNAPAETFLKVAEFTESFGTDVIRFTVRQNIQLRNLPEAYLGNVYQLVSELGQKADVPALVNNVISCTGADTCRLGICLPKGAAAALRYKLNESSLPVDELKDLHINISGCPNSCAQQRWADLGFAGRVSRNDSQKMFPAYTIFAGADRTGNGELGNPFGVVSAKDLPDFTHDLLEEYLKVKAKYASFREYILNEGAKTIALLTEKYADVPSLEENPDYYYDWGSTEQFSVVNKGPAECSAGLFDLIDVDLKTIQTALDSLEGEGDLQKVNQLLYTIVFASSRMLLVTRGAEAKTTEETFDLFIDKFIKEGYVSKEFTSLVEAAKADQKYEFGKNKEAVIALAKEVIALYESMDDSLQFKVKAEPAKEEKAEAARVKDLRGVACPFNFVKTKIELSTLKSGDLLEILLDDGQPIENVPGSVRNEGHEVVSATPVQDYWKVLIRKA
ncbi:MAG: sulfurtransferase TusA family protein [Bacteroidota bacterium]|nr:sulfurtransferase TusA family protein [Bacteroidota bacterium]